MKDIRKPIGDYHLEIGPLAGDVTLIHKDGDTCSDPARAMSHLMKKVKELEEKIEEMGWDYAEREELRDY